MGAQTLEEVLPAAQVGEAWAVRRVYDLLSPRVLAYFRARGAREPEDLTSEVFLTVLPRLGTVTGGEAGLRTFTFSVAHARLVDDLRARSRRAESAAYDPDDDPRTSPSAEVEGLASLEGGHVQQLLAELVPDQRDVLVLRILGDLTVEQVARTLGKTEGAVKQLQRRGLLALRRRLEPEGQNHPKGVTL